MPRGAAAAAAVAAAAVAVLCVLHHAPVTAHGRQCWWHWTAQQQSPQPLPPALPNGSVSPLPLPPLLASLSCEAARAAGVSCKALPPVMRARN
ncbi:hypothetical protein JKP88DRAFT_192255 [Tribonema minus]|uniref:Secreted protein n=1 Tax=Tribonema minus TaxID=303371 RepID=A0A835Z9I6_9STRA|nr:hypothetical protein JKP88DRAFT_192255 [Tribonema minus]